MSESTKTKSGILGYITAIIIAAMLCGTLVFASIQYREAANIQAQSARDSADTIKSGLNDLGKGICNGHNTGYSGCRY